MNNLRFFVKMRIQKNKKTFLTQSPQKPTKTPKKNWPKACINLFAQTSSLRKDAAQKIQGKL